MNLMWIKLLTESLNFVIKLINKLSFILILLAELTNLCLNYKE